VFQGLPVKSVWRFNDDGSPVRFILDANQLLPDKDGWLTWVPANGAGHLHIVRSFAEDLADEFGVLHAFLRFALVVLVCAANGFAVGAEVCDEIAGHFVGDELRAERGLGGLCRGGVGGLALRGSTTMSRRAW